MINILIVDDEPLARENLAIRLEDVPDMIICGQADNGHDAILLTEKLNPDVIFLDINMPGMNGIDAASQLKASHDTMVIFITAYSEHAIDAFRVNALDYLVKPINDQHFLTTLERIRDKAKRNQTIQKISATQTTYLKRLGIKDGQTISMVDVNTIEAIETAGDYLCIHSNNKTYIHRQPLKNLLDLIDPNQFLQIHRSTVINVNFLKNISDSDGLNAQMNSGETFKISRRYQKQVRDKVLKIK